MAKQTLIRTSSFPYHVMARSNNREWFSVSPNDAWNIIAKHAFTVTLAYGARFHAFVVMSNHFHCLLTTPDSNLDDVMNYFLREVSKEINSVAKKINHVFGTRYKWSLIQDPSHYATVLKYVYRNPVTAGICENVEDYPYSTLHGLLGLSKLPFPLHYPPQDFYGDQKEVSTYLESFNISYVNESQTKLIAGALRRSIFGIPERIARSRRRARLNLAS